MMFRPLALLIGSRYTGGPGGSRLSAFLSRTAIAGLALGVGLLITVLAVMSGFEREMRVRILGLVPHITLYPGSDAAPWQDTARQLADRPGIRAVAPLVQLNGMLVKGGDVATALLFGVDATHERAATIIADYIDEDGWRRFAESGSGVILGAGIAERLGAAAGDRITLVVPHSGGARMASRIERIAVAGVLHSGTELDESLALLPLATAQRLGEVADEAVSLRVMVEDLFEAPEIGMELWRARAGRYGVSDWTHAQGNLYSAIELSKRLVGMMLAIVIAVAVFNVVSALVLVVNDKQGDIAILRTQGARPRTIVAIFLVQGFLVGSVGTALGVVFGVGLSLVVTDLVAGIETVFGIQFLKSDVYPVSYLPAELLWQDVLTVALTALAMSALAALYPAWRAARLQPAAALRHD